MQGFIWLFHEIVVILHYETLGISLFPAPGVGMRVCGLACLADIAAGQCVENGCGGADGSMLCAFCAELRHRTRPRAADVGTGDVQRWKLHALHPALPLHAFPRKRLNGMPRRYWKYMTEKQ